MFVIIPIVIVFFGFAYLKFNPDVSPLTQGFIYFLMIITIFSTYKLYANIKKNMKIQEKNKIQQEINRIYKKLSKEKSELRIKSYKMKIKNLQSELEAI